MKIRKVRIVKEDGIYYPEYKRLFRWKRFTKHKCQEVSIQTFCGDIHVQCKTYLDAKDYASSKMTRIFDLDV